MEKSVVDILKQWLDNEWTKFKQQIDIYITWKSGESYMGLQAMAGF